MFSGIKKFLEGHISGDDLPKEKIEEANKRLEIDRQYARKENVIYPFLDKRGLENSINTFQESIKALEGCDAEERKSMKEKITGEINSYLEMLDEQEFEREINKLNSIKSYIEEKF